MVKSDTSLNAEGLQEFLPLGGSQFAILVRFEFAESDMHDASPFEVLHLVAQRGAHAADLVLFSFGEGEGEAFLIVRMGDRDGWFGAITFDIDTTLQGAEQHPTDRFIDRDIVLLFVASVWIEERASDAAIVGQQHQSLGVFIESADGCNSGEPVVGLEFGGDVYFTVSRRMSDHPTPFIVGEVGLWSERTGQGHLLFGGDLITQLRWATINQYFARLDQGVRFAAGANPGVGKVFIDATGKFHDRTMSRFSC